MVQVEVLSRPPANGAMVLPLRAPATELSRREFPFTVLCSKAQRWWSAAHVGRCCCCGFIHQRWRRQRGMVGLMVTARLDQDGPCRRRASESSFVQSPFVQSPFVQS